jgi:hypothetical protein
MVTITRIIGLTSQLSDAIYATIEGLKPVNIKDEDS